jgi:hypothetical protein
VDFAADQFIDGRRMRIFVVVADCTRECLALIADTSISGIRVARGARSATPRVWQAEDDRLGLFLDARISKLISNLAS